MDTAAAIPDWLWIPITLWAAFAQTVRNAAQRGLTAQLGTLGATLVRFLYGMPFALVWLWIVQAWTAAPLPAVPPVFWAWVAFGGLTQIAAMALLLRTMQDRNFALAVAYGKSEVLQVAVFGLVLLADPITLAIHHHRRIEQNQRIAAAEQGKGIGGRMLPALQDWVFAHPNAHRLHLHFSAENARGRRLYARAGFQDEGVERQVYKMPGGGRVDTFRVSILRPEWERLRAV